MLVILLMIPLTGAGIDIYVPSLPAITHDFGVTENLVQLTIPAYLIGYSVAQLFYGALSDAIGRKKLLIAGVIFYIITSVVAPFSHTIYTLIFIRFLQGVGISAPGVLAKAIVNDSFDKSELPIMTNYMTIAWAIGPILAPMLGGYLQFYFNWHASFYFLALYGLLNLITIILFLPETNKNRHPVKLSTLMQNYKTTFSSKTFIICIIALAILYAYMILFNIVGPFLVESVLNYSPIVFGHLALLLGIAWFLGSLCNRFLIKYYSVPTLIKIGVVINLLASLFMWICAISHFLNLSILIIPTLFIFFGGSIMFTNYFGTCLSIFPNIAGTASAAMGTLFIAGTAFTGALASMLKTQTQLPLASCYLVMTLIILLLSFKMKNLELD